MDILNKEYRKSIVDQIESEENKQRKAISLKQSEIMSDRFFQYVVEELKRQFSPETVQEMPIVSFINFTKRIVEQEASIYSDSPERTISGVSDELAEKIRDVYSLAFADSKLKSANKKFKLQDQTHLMILPKNKKLVLRSLYMHQIDAIPSHDDPETAQAYIISAFDKERFLTYQNSKSATGHQGRGHASLSYTSGVNHDIADENDYKKSVSYYTYWSREHNFVMNGHGDLIDPATREVIENPTEEDFASPIPGVMPIVDIANEKDYEYFVRSGMALSDFGVQYNAAMSDTWHIARMQGYSVGVLTGPDEMIPSSIKLGPNYILRLKTKPEEGSGAGEVDFKYTSPTPNLEGTLKLLETMLMNFISSRGLDPKEISQEGSKSYTSALERMLAMIEKFEASKDDFKVFKRVEDEVFEIIKAWVNNASDQLDEKFNPGKIPDNAYLDVKFKKPELVETEDEKVTKWKNKIDAGFASIVDAIKDIYELDEKAAIDRLEKIREENEKYGKKQSPEIQNPINQLVEDVDNLENEYLEDEGDANQAIA